MNILDSEALDDAQCLLDTFAHGRRDVDWHQIEMPTHAFKKVVGWAERDPQWFHGFAGAELIEEIARESLQHFPVLWMARETEGSNYGLEGNHRAAAMIALGYRTIPLYCNLPLDGFPLMAE